MGKFKKKSEWVEHLYEYGCEDWADAVDSARNPIWEDEDNMSAYEVMEIIAKYEGGIGYAFNIDTLIDAVWGIDISEEAIRW